MAFFLITSKDTSELETNIFESEAGDAASIFTDQKRAQEFIDNAGWQDEMVVAELKPIQFMEWLIMCYQSGVKLLATDPRRSEQESGLKVNMLEIEAQLEHAGEHIFQVAQRDF